MARPHLETQALRRISELSTETTEELEAIVNWAETEMSIAQDAFDKPRQGRVGRLLVNVSRLTLLLSKIQQETTEGR
ncbi:hypothetical protein GC175_27585 [bacterium]|nr:hypothetical protein [bacterium]